ncbi:hypothetical protein ACFWBH_20330 [Streptomyces sp. NPDC059999]|uniref:hypothetical protein n=1 Tax=Streptomyces sp. NPDC059999 TaxID=3347030 RepID=UPI00368E0E63
MAWGSREVLDATLVRPEPPVGEISADAAIDRGGAYRHPHPRLTATADAYGWFDEETHGSSSWTA